MIKDLCKLLVHDDAEVRWAAAMVVSELKLKDPAVRKALHKALQTPDERVQFSVLRALDRIGIGSSLEPIVPLLGGSSRLKSRVAELLLRAGEKGAKILRGRLKSATTGVRRGILEVLGQTSGTESVETLLESLLDDEFEIVRQATDSMIEQVKQLPGKERPGMRKKVIAFLGSPKGKKKPYSTIGGIRILGYLSDPGAIQPLLGFVGRKNPDKVRTHALNSLSHLDVAAQAKSVISKLLPLLEEDNPDILERALRVLQSCVPGKDALPRLLKLLQKSRRPAVRIYAARALAALGSSQAADALAEALFSDDETLVGVATSAFRNDPKLAPVLVKALKKEKDQERAWKIANILRTYGARVGKPVLKDFLKKCISAAGKRDGSFQVYFEILRSVDPDGLREALLKKGRELLRTKKYEEADVYLRPLDRDDLATEEAIYTLAVCRLATLRKDLSQAHRDRSHAVGLFSTLVRKGAFPLMKRLEKETGVLKPDDFLYLGFCFAERPGRERELGGQILKFVAKKYKGKAAAKIAKQKFSTQGLGRPAPRWPRRSRPPSAAAPRARDARPVARAASCSPARPPRRGTAPARAAPRLPRGSRRRRHAGRPGCLRCCGWGWGRIRAARGCGPSRVARLRRAAAEGSRRPPRPAAWPVAASSPDASRRSPRGARGWP